MKIVLLESLAVSEEKVAALAAPLIAAGHSFVAYTDGARDVDLLIERAKDADILMAVSYTHLDVYKRQALRCCLTR